MEATAPLPVVGPGLGPAVSARAARLAARWVPEAWRGARLDPGRRGAMALVAVAAVAALVAAAGVWRDRPVAEPALPLASAVGPAGGGPAGGEVPAGPGVGRPAGVPLVVSVAGKVRRPGLVKVPDGARVADAIAAAGGPLPRIDLTALNLARRVADGEQLLVGVAPPPGAEPAAGVPGPAPSGGGAAAAGGGATAGGKVDLNRATVEQLDTLPGVGPVTAQRILDWRTRHGRFTSVDQLREVEGIGERRFGQLKSLVTV